ncbi:major capsid protein [Sigmofec virus UA08Rod_4577]|uniref:Major capsid protein n=1 Tax=Sigmofec virus UA08Rod_4577 TaxID=2929404 RepID=A0A976N0S3_9VIRU|nr:major capsid protein [Sigmofec virus UA08Rod_4577]
MAHRSNIFESIPIDLPKRSGFDLSFENLLTQKCGTLVPLLVEELLPNDTISLGYFSQVELPPLATNFFGRVDYCLEAFFVPMRLCWGGWKYFWTMPIYDPFEDNIYRPTALPSLTYTSSAALDPAGPSSLADYLGVKRVLYKGGAVTRSIPNALPFIAYHRIYDDHYRNRDLHKPLFHNPNNYSSVPSASEYLQTCPFVTLCSATDTVPSSFSASALFGDGSSIFDLHQRQWAKDYYTTAALYPQAAQSSVEVKTPEGQEAGTFTIAQLRNANSLQRLADRNNLAGFDYPNQIYSQYGVTPPDSLIDKPVFLGHSSFSIYSKGVAQTSSSMSGDSGKNPFNGIQGNKAGSGNGFGEDSLIDNFHTKEHGYLFVIGSIVPHAYYSTGNRRYLYRSVQGDFAIPLLQGLGEQPIYSTELSGDSFSKVEVFGYQQQYSEYKYHDDEVHGILRDGESLQYYALQRSFNPDSAFLDASFVEIPTDYLDQVFAVTTESSGFSAWCDFFFEFKKVSTLSEYVIPTLGDLKNTYKGHVDYRGSELRG